ncbi:Reticulon-4-interacting protein 1-like protein, mitochondrial [Chlamydiales bacterium STE3]|nr:Reticulon-4-interacting protein 1-like protein, mitochondrial [Chlamydiales bacterium STE3]
MKAMIIEAFGDSEQLKLSEIPNPLIKDNEVMIAVEYAGVNPVDWKIREGLYKSKMPHEFPLIPGWDASGTIINIGKHVKNFHIGDKVFAYCRKPTIKEGTYAEFVCFDATQVAQLPHNLSFAQGAAIPLAGLTAWQALFDFAQLQNGQTVLIHAGSGGVGSLAIQFAKKVGAIVFTTCSESNHPYVTKLGADYCIDYNKDDFSKKIEELVGKVDVVFDTVGGKTLRDSLSLVKPNGCIVSIVEQLGHDLVGERNMRAGYVFVRPDGKELEEIAKLIEEGDVIAPEIQEMPLQNAPQAQEKNKGGHTRGKIVLKIGQQE